MWHFIIHDWMIEELHLKGRELFVYAYLHSWSGKEIFLKDWQIASMLGMSRSVLSRTIKSLREKGFVDEKSTTLLTKSQQKSCQKVNKKLPKSQQKVDKKSTRRCQKVNDTIHIQDTIQNNTSSNAPAPERTHEYIITGIVDFYAERGQTYMPNWSTMTTSAAELDAKMVFLAKNKKIAPDGDSLATLWTDFLNAAYAHADEWQRNHFTLDTLNSQFQVFINQISNGRQHNNGSGGVSDDYIADAIRTAFGGVSASAD